MSNTIPFAKTVWLWPEDIKEYLGSGSRIAFVCDRKPGGCQDFADKPCESDPCRHTENIEHAVDYGKIQKFEVHGKNLWEVS